MGGLCQLLAGGWGRGRERAALEAAYKQVNGGGVLVGAGV